uniref:RNA-directed RNA polymerase n=1 Tax=Panagrellus redivivus TaxID=6233 RepID=A0A7E4VVL3_PANRE
MERYRFTVTAYQIQDVAKYKIELIKKLNKSVSFKYECDPNHYESESGTFWVDVVFDKRGRRFNVIPQALREFKAAISEDRTTVSWDTLPQVDAYHCADANICVRNVEFGLIHNQFEAQPVCTVDPTQQKQLVDIPNFKENGKQIFRVSFFHDQRRCELSMPMIDELNAQRSQIRKLQKGRGNDFEITKLQEFLDKQNDPGGLRHFKNEVMVRLPYENIKLVVFDIQKAHGGMVTADIVIVYEHPPTVYVYPMSDDERFSNSSPSYIRWSESFSLCDFIQPMIHSSTMKMRIYLKYEVFFSLLNMLKLRLPCPISFRQIHNAANAINLKLKTYTFQDGWPFELKYLIDCILSRGSIGYQFLMGSRDDYQMIHDKIDEFLWEGDDGLKKATAYLMNIFFKVVKADLESLQSEFEEEAIKRKFNHAEHDSNYVMIPRAVVTPTRILYYPPELSMSSRLIRHFGADRFLRVVFRDDSMDTLHNVSEELIDETVTKLLKYGLKVGDEQFYYLGYSNSQLRDQGCYFYRGESVKDLIRVYRHMGRFKEEGTAKTMARFAQCFTQAYPSQIRLPEETIAEIPDVSNSACTVNGAPYCFSDGVGMMSLKMAKQLQTELHLCYVPSCFQFRFAGYKGVLSVNPYMTKYAEYINAHMLSVEAVDAPWMKDALFRPSQNKFTANQDHIGFEMVKYAAPCVVHLSKQLINIYDQVAVRQSQSAHESITTRILQLTDVQIEAIMKSLTDETHFRKVLQELPAIVPFRKLKSLTNLIVEPFFRRLVLAWTKYSLKNLSEKARIRVPPNLGRNMFGIIDETGYLQYGQVFVQYSEFLNDEFSSNHIVLTGDVMITKNPMMSGGDLRKFQAVNIPALRHLVDVVVFSQHGSRPAPDEMAGSDLDGDEYSVIWDPELMLDYNEPAVDYSAPSSKTAQVPPRSRQKQMVAVREESIKFFKNYLLNDGIGVVANAHLANSDLYGIDSNVCQNIAKKQIAAVDFAKSGVPMQPLTKCWANKQPPEKVQQYPDFMSKEHRPFYHSKRLLGQVHRKVQRFVDYVYSFIDGDADMVGLDVFIDVNGWVRFQQEAETVYENYVDEIQRLLVTYGIKDEAELFTQCFTDIKFSLMRNQEADNLSGFSTASMIQKHLYEILSRYRLNFFSGYRGIDKEQKDNRKFFHAKFTGVVSGLLRCRAVAYYKVAYAKGQFLSFPWIVWDILDFVAVDKQANSNHDPCSQHISNAIARVQPEDVADLKELVKSRIPDLKKYLLQNPGLDAVLVVLDQWKDSRKELIKVATTELFVMFMKYAIGGFVNTPAVVDTVDKKQSPTAFGAQSGGPGRTLMNFFKTLSQDDFFDYPENWLTVPNYGNYTNEDFCDIEKWKMVILHARDTYFKSVFQSSPSLFASDSSTTSTGSIGQIFTIEVMHSFVQCIHETLMTKLQTLSGCTHIAFRFPDHETTVNQERDDYRVRVILWPSGTHDAIQRLRNMLTIDAPLFRDNSSDKGMGSSSKPAQLAALMRSQMEAKLTKAVYG